MLRPTSIRHLRRRSASISYYFSVVYRYRRSSSSSHAATFHVDADTGLVTTTTSRNNNNVKSVPPIQFQTIVGLEVHAQIASATKLFSRAPTEYNTNSISSSSNAPNSRLDLLDAGVPGSLPILPFSSSTCSIDKSMDSSENENRSNSSDNSVNSILHKAILAAAALDCQTITNVCRWERKHYHYADLPLGYQMTQQRWPLAENGRLEYYTTTMNNNKKVKHTCRVERLQLEQDSGKTTAMRVPSWKANTNNTSTAVSAVDLNRAGGALLEIVTAPNMRSAAQAVAAVEHLRQLLVFGNICDGQMHRGSLRVDVNVNLKKIGCDAEDDDDSDIVMTPRVEVKNLNSIQQIRHAILYEAQRQAQECTQNSNSTAAFGETRTWDVAGRKTVRLRTKEEAPDYRFMPEPDLPALRLIQLLGLQSSQSDASGGISTEILQEYGRRHLPELPTAARKRLQAPPYQLSAYQAQVLVQDDRSAVDLLDATLDELTKADSAPDDPKSQAQLASLTTNLIVNEIMGIIKQKHQHRQQVECNTDDPDSVDVRAHIAPHRLAAVVGLLHRDEISRPVTKQILEWILLHTATTKESNNTGDPDAGADPVQWAREQGLLNVVAQKDDLTKLVHQVLAEYPEEVQAYRDSWNAPATDTKGDVRLRTKLTKLWVGKGMKVSRGTAQPQRLAEVLEHILKSQQ